MRICRRHGCCEARPAVRGRLRSIWTVQKVLAIKFVNENKDVINSYGKDEERNDFCDDQGHFDLEEGEETDCS